jgi:hypothetical protein
MVDDRVGGFGPTQRLAPMTLLPAGLLARRFAQAADTDWLLQPIARRWLAAVAAVQPKTALQFRQPPCQGRILGAKQPDLSLQCRDQRFADGRARGVV